MTADAPKANGPLPKASLLDSLRTVSKVLLPLVARGLIIRRPPIVAAAERADLDRTAVQHLQHLHERYGQGPLQLRVGRRVAVVLAPEHARRVLDHSPEPFSPATTEKRHALAQFQPRGVLISTGAARQARRDFNEDVLDTDQPLHRDASGLVDSVGTEADLLLRGIGEDGELTWDAFMEGWMRVVRHVVFGGSAAEDDQLTDLLAELRAAGNWAYLRPKQRRTREQFLRRIREHIAQAQPGSLAYRIHRGRAPDIDAPEEQIPQWLFAFDPAGIALFRALALIATHPEHADAVTQEVADATPGVPHELPATRACVLESLRLWPTTPAVLRETTMRTRWEGGILPRDTSVLLYAPFFHRDDRHLPYADRFAPELWLDPETARSQPLFPFSGGPAICPGRDVVLLTTSTLLGRILARYHVTMDDPGRLDPSAPLPSVLNPFDLRFHVRSRTQDDEVIQLPHDEHDRGRHEQAQDAER